MPLLFLQEGHLDDGKIFIFSEPLEISAFPVELL